MDAKKVHFRHILLFYFRKGKNAAEAMREICNVYGEESITHSICAYWFRRFRSSDFNLEDAPRSGRPNEVNDEQILELVNNDRHITTQEIADKLKLHRTTISSRLKKLGFEKVADAWVPHKSTEKKN